MDCTLTDAEMAALVEGADCFVSLHRAEGFGYHLIESMSPGTPVVATSYSGNLDFCTPMTAYLVECEQRPIARGEYPHASPSQTWAEPVRASAVAALRAVRHDAEARSARVSQAKSAVEGYYSIEAYADRVGIRLSALLDER